jgi:hypothetical protein
MRIVNLPGNLNWEPETRLRGCGSQLARLLFGEAERVDINTNERAQSVKLVTS